MGSFDAIAQRAEELSKKFNKISDKLQENLDTVEDISVKGTDIIEYVDKNILTQPIETLTAPETYYDLISLSELMQDFAYIRKTLRENSDLGRQILHSMSTDVYSGDEESLAALITAFAQLNTSISNNLKLFITAYKDLTNIIVNMERAKAGFNKTNQTLNVNVSNEQAQRIVKTTADIIAEITGHAQ